MEYNFKEIEAKWQRRWQEEETYRVEADPTRPKFYVLDMFPYPSGAGLHVGHPLGYIASDIYSRYKRLCGFNVLHPMGYDAFGLPAEQYAIQTGQHPAVTTERNIARYREQLDKIGFSFDWHREVRTCDPSYYKWTQWAFLEMFKHYYDRSTDKAEPIEKLVARFEAQGTEGLDAACTQEMRFTADEWKSKTEEEREQILQNYRLAFRADTMVNWCPQLGTVLANDEVKDGLSERGGFPVEQKRMKQWLLRVTAYAQRMLDGLERLEWSDSLKEIQRNWIGRSEGAQVFFDIQGSDRKLEIFTTRPDTIFGVTFMVIAPEHEWVHDLTTSEQRAAVEEYIAQAKKRSERERIAETKRVSGVATGSYAINPFTGKAIPIYISDYVLAGYGTGAIMAVPAHDSRDYAFARHFGLEIIPVVEGGDIEKESYDAKSGKLINSDLLDGLDVKEAIGRILGEIERRGLGRRLVNYRLRDAIFSRQRYWGEPFPIYYKEGTAYPLPEERLPLELARMHIHSTIIERDPARCRVMKTLLPEATIICADGTKPDVLREEGLPEADALVTLTESDETNLIISSFAHHENVPKIVTKVDEDNFIQLAESYGLTTIIQPADVTAGRIVEYVRWMQNSAHSSGVETLRMVADGQAEALEFIVRAESQFLDVPLKALKLKDSVLVASIIRRGKCRVPSGNDAIELGDRVVVVTTNHGMHELKDILK